MIELVLLAGTETSAHFTVTGSELRSDLVSEVNVVRGVPGDVFYAAHTTVTGPLTPSTSGKSHTAILTAVEKFCFSSPPSAVPCMKEVSDMQYSYIDRAGAMSYELKHTGAAKLKWHTIPALPSTRCGRSVHDDHHEPLTVRAGFIKPSWAKQTGRALPVIRLRSPATTALNPVPTSRLRLLFS
ncbi:hypothetical protein R1sor_019370 [Riccia sorocarpa]|uniref:Uncharacterized protein n=1 Tax=Riccia sorocarpa TaxID=122646 RepID=A0ABD3ICC3_9MARC